jgi:hypothetical protein
VLHFPIFEIDAVTLQQFYSIPAVKQEHSIHVGHVKWVNSKNEEQKSYFLTSILSHTLEHRYSTRHTAYSVAPGSNLA